MCDKIPPCFIQERDRCFHFLGELQHYKQEKTHFASHIARINVDLGLVQYKTRLECYSFMLDSKPGFQGGPMLGAIVFSNLAHVICQYISLDSKLVLAGPNIIIIVFSNLAHIIFQYISLDPKLIIAGPYIGMLENSRQSPLSPVHSYNPVTMVTTLIQSTFMFHIVLVVGFLGFTHRQSGIHAVDLLAEQSLVLI